MNSLVSDILISCKFFEWVWSDVQLRLVCKKWKNEIDNVSWIVRLGKYESVVNPISEEVKDLSVVRFNDVRFIVEDVIVDLVNYCCNWTGYLFKPKNTKDIVNYCQLPNHFDSEATRTIAIIDALWSNSTLCFEDFLNNSFENYFTILLLLLASEKGFINKTMRLKNCLVREFILLFTGFSSLRTRKSFQEEPFVTTIYQPNEDMYFPTVYMFHSNKIIDGSELRNLVPYHQRQIMIALTSIFSYDKNFKFLHHLPSLVSNLGNQINVPCYDTTLKIVGLNNLFELLKNQSAERQIK